ncbi:HEAT repeat domain-containing protein [bacterium]|nr:HEAT repeat domain-containing protein [bacterium]
MFREKIAEFLKKAEEYKVIFIWVFVAIILISLLRFTFWFTKRGKSEGTRTYIKQLSSKDVEKRKEALYSLGQDTSKSALPKIEKMLMEDPDLGVKRVAAWSLGSLDKDKLVSLLDSKDANIKAIAIETLMKLDKENVKYLVGLFSSEGLDGKKKILSYIESSDISSYTNELMKIAERPSEVLEIRKEALNMFNKVDIQEDIESRLLNLYYNDENQEIKNLSYEVIQKSKTRKSRQ